MVKIFPTCFDATLQHLSLVEKHPRLIYSAYQYRHMRDCQADLRYYRMLIWCIPDCDANLLADFDFLATSIPQLYKLDGETDTEYDSLLMKVEEKRSKCGAELVNNDHYRWHLISYFSREAAEPSCFTSKNETMEFLDSVDAVLNDVLKDMNKSIQSIIPNLDSQIESLVELVFLLRNLVYYTPMGGDQESSIAYSYDTNPQTKLIFQFDVHDWANKAACFSLLHGPVGIYSGMSTRLLIDLQQIVDPCNPDFIKLCFEAIKVPKMKDRLLFGDCRV